ncbi:GNAT family N-acetyltransferase [Maribacter algicola]|uniref:GNAT family N-acetyltransferase n=1 Tax=Meishania litoralis TaxID=3434685 RepID=A0ACC7LM83_9FLAO
MIMEDFPELRTERLVLNQPKWNDVPVIVSHADNIKIVENTRTMPHPYHEEDAISWIQMVNQGFQDKDRYIFAVRLNLDDSFIGGIGLTLDVQNNRAELGYWIAEPFWNLGFATEAVEAILKFGFETLGLNKIIAVYLTTNSASGKVMVKNGMIKEAELIDHDVKRDHTIDDNVYVSLIQYRLLKKEYESLKK